MNVLLIESHYRTRTWLKALQPIKSNLSVVSVISEERDLFYSNGLKKEDVLDLHNPDVSDCDYHIAEQYLLSFEKQVGMCVNEIALMDRTLRLRDNDFIIKYLYYIAKSLKEFIQEKQIDLVFIEPTWSHEILVTKICESLNIPVYAPVKDKILANRFFIFKGYKHKEVFHRVENLDSDEIGQDSIDSVLSLEKPQYFSKFNKRNKLTLSKLRVLYDISKLALLKQKNNNIQPPWLKSIRKKVSSIVKAKYLLIFSPFVNQGDIKRKYILVTLHVQPEASIDVVGVKYFDQVDFVRQIVRTTPATHLVVVKEHPHAFGDRPLGFYRELLSIPRVLVLSPFSESRHAIKMSDLVVSNTGTSSLEAAIMGVPGITATEMYFRDLMIVPSFNPSVESISHVLLKSEAWKTNYDRQWVHKIMSRIQKNSFKGNSGDFKTDPGVFSKKNIEHLRRAFSEIIEFHK